MSFILNSGRFGAAADPGLTLLQSATLWLDASDDVANAQWKRNKGTGGRSLDARQGSVGSAQIVKGALKLNGVLGNYASTPDAAALDLTGDSEMVARIAPLDWTPSANARIICKRDTVAQGNYDFCLLTGGTLFYTDNCAGSGSATSTSAVPFSDGTAGWVKVTYRDSDKRVQFFTATDQATEPSSWTQLGTDVTRSGSGSPAATTYPLCVGGIGSSFDPFNGTIYRAIVRNGIGGTIVFDADFTAVADLASSFTESSSNAATVTINSTTGVDTNDPLLLTHTGTNYLYLPGANSDFVSSPDSASVSPTGDFEILMRVALTDWTPSTINYLIAKSDGATNRTFQVYVDTTGAIVLSMSTDSTSFGSSVTSSVPPFTNDTSYWLRVTRTQSTGSVTFEYAADSSSIPSSWSALTGGTGTTSALSDNAGLLRIGNTPSNLPLNGRVFRAVLRKTISGANDFDANFSTNTNQSSFTESSSNAATVTINRSTSGRKSVMVTRPVWLFGTDDYMEIADNALLDMDASQSFTVIAVHRKWINSSISYERLIEKTSDTSANDGWSLNFSGASTGNVRPNSGIDSGANTASFLFTTGTDSGVASLYAMTVDRGSQLLNTWRGTTSGTPQSTSLVGTLANSFPLRVGYGSAGGTTFMDGEIVAVAVFRSALTSTELGQIATYYGV